MSEAVTTTGTPQNQNQGAPAQPAVQSQPTAAPAAVTPPAQPAAGGSLIDPGTAQPNPTPATPAATTAQPASTATGGDKPVAAQNPEPPKTDPAVPQRIVPEKYELKAPEKSPLTPEAIKRVEEYAKANKLTQDEAQRELIRENDSVKRLQEGVNEAMKQQVDRWINEVKSDPEIGGENYTRTVQRAQLGVAKVGNAKLIDRLNKSGLGNDPELVRAFAKVGALFEDDKAVHAGNPVSAAQPDVLKVMYDKTK